MGVTDANGCMELVTALLLTTQYQLVAPSSQSFSKQRQPKTCNYIYSLVAFNNETHTISHINPLDFGIKVARSFLFVWTLLAQHENAFIT